MRTSKEINKVFSSIDHPLMVQVLEEVKASGKADFITGDEDRISYLKSSTKKKILDYNLIINDGHYDGKIAKFLKESNDGTNLYRTIDNETVYLSPERLVEIPVEIMEENAWNSVERVDVKIGRFFKKFLPEEIKSSQVEELVNVYKGTYSTIYNKNERLCIVKGTDITKWYFHKNNEANVSIMHGTGSLNKSCSGHAKNIDLYQDNSNISMLILYSDKEKGKISGRAIVWTSTAGKIFMDRIYTVNESDNQLFYKYAVDNGWYVREHNSAGISRFRDPDGNYTSERINVQLEKWDYDGYPYADTIIYLDMATGIVSNMVPESGTLKGIRKLQLYGGRGGWVDMEQNCNVESKRDPYNPSHW